MDDSRAGEFLLTLLRGIKGKEAIKAFLKAGGAIKKAGMTDDEFIKLL